MISPSDIKAGAQFVVTVASDGVDSDGWVEILGEGGTKHYVRQKAIAMVSSPSPTATVDTVISDARGWGTGGDGFGDIPSTAANKPTTAAIDAEIVEAAEQWRASNRRRPVSQPYPDDIGLLERLAHLIDRRRAMMKPLDEAGGIMKLLGKIVTDAREMRDMAEALAARVRKERGERSGSYGR